ncbi:hypothetical protein Bca4012_097569 [Brassica carinata]|nr:PREDICTED: uncharacterized protein LOC106298454 [Brassica oleracea var. oleracea]XP_013646111.1 uncharacterized protein BNAC06G00720D [Brassica napus]KAF2607963.1 hypothetical protein F2Q68_00043065 [Brassica cretica]KAG2250195.1 hypothetical protein Bca52824_080331 [Brassica carinata]KAJ4917340.1 Adenine nucleotide alpha hydrolases-like superfamily protein [Raphanus sativus]KAF3516480.1 hypothetical protein DY000_02058554 [Brassica cretica]CAF2053742.1 unnamed protein product [Brassica na
MQFSRNSILRQLSRKEGWRSASRRWTSGDSSTAFADDTSGGAGGYSSMEGLYGVYSGEDPAARRKRVMVVVDETSRSKHAMMWALTHLTNKGDLMTLLHVVSPHDEASPSLVQSLGSLCKACKPEVDVEALVIQGPKLATVLSQVKKLEVTVLVLGQKKSAPFISCLCGPSRSEELVNRCINGADCLTIGVRKQSNGVSGYLINTRWQKNFWLLA